jgi:predicted alpha/beta-hydrolase family hydrolase
MKRPRIVFAPGAGAPSSSAWMRQWAARLGTLGEVQTFDYAYQVARRRRPDPLPELIAAHRAAIGSARVGWDGPLVLAGKSMGGRIGCHASLEDRVDALVCFGYPLRAAGSGKLRDQVLLDLKTPVLFLQGTRDELCPLDLLAQVRPRMTALNELYVVETGDHSLQVFKKTPQGPVDEALLETVRVFLERTLA